MCGSRCAREGASSEAEMSPRARQNPLEGGVSHRARRNQLEGGVSPRARRSLLEGGVCPRARRSLLEGKFEWVALVGRGSYRGVGRALCVRLRKMRLSLVFCRFQAGFPHLFKGTPRAVPDRPDSQSLRHYPRSRSCTGTGHATTPQQEQDSPGQLSTPRHYSPRLHT
jgi:hypothetical protein